MSAFLGRRGVRRGGSALVCAAVVLVSVLLVRGQAAPGNAGAARVVLGEDMMVPGEQVTVPCSLETGGTDGIGSLEIEVTFPSAKVEFDSVRRGLISDQLGARIDHEVFRSGSDPSFSTVRLRFTPKEKVAIPEGFLFDLVFRINKEVPLGEPPVVLKNQARAFGAGPAAEPLAGVNAQDGLIHVVAEPPPVASCFFYMH